VAYTIHHPPTTIILQNMCDYNKSVIDAS
jgi:hypothetical protein